MSEDDKTLVVRPAQACKMLQMGREQLYKLINSGELESYTEGRARKIEVASIRAYIRRKIEQERRPGR